MALTKKELQQEIEYLETINTPAAKAEQTELKQRLAQYDKKEQQRQKRNARNKARYAAMTSINMKKTKYGWE